MEDDEASGNPESLGSFNFEQVYFDEMRAFLDALRGVGPYPKTWSDDRHLSDVLVAAEESWEKAQDGLTSVKWRRLTTVDPGSRISLW